MHLTNRASGPHKAGAEHVATDAAGAPAEESEETREKRLFRALKQAYLSLQGLTEDAERILERTKEALESLEPFDPST